MGHMGCTRLTLTPRTGCGPHPGHLRIKPPQEYDYRYECAGMLQSPAVVACCSRLL